MPDHQTLISQCLEKCQVNNSVHGSVSRELHKAHKKSPTKFRRAFIEEINQVLVVEKREATVERLIRFFVSFTTGQHLKPEHREGVQGFTDFFLQYLLSLTAVSGKAVRFRSCQLIAGIVQALSRMGDVELG